MKIDYQTLVGVCLMITMGLGFWMGFNIGTSWGELKAIEKIQPLIKKLRNSSEINLIKTSKKIDEILNETFLEIEKGFDSLVIELKKCKNLKK